MADVKKPFSTMNRVSWYALRWVFRGVRVSLAWVALMICLAFVMARVSIANASDVGMNFSDELTQIGDHHATGDMAETTYTIHFNGQTFQSSNYASTRPMGEVLDYFQDQCRNHAGGLRDTFGNLGSALSKLEPANGTEGFLVMRRDHDDRGYVFCVAPDRTLTSGDKFHRLKAFTKSGDLHAVGDMRYVAVEKTAFGSQVVTAWTDGPFFIQNMFPAQGDAPGVDFGNVPRPDGARRTFSGNIEGSTSGLNVYEAPGAVPAVLAGLDAKLEGAGWRRLKPGPGAAENARFYSLGTSMDLVMSVDPAGSKNTRATYVVSQNSGHASM